MAQHLTDKGKGKGGRLWPESAPDHRREPDAVDRLREVERLRRKPQLWPIKAVAPWESLRRWKDDDGGPEGDGCVGGLGGHTYEVTVPYLA